MISSDPRGPCDACRGRGALLVFLLGVGFGACTSPTSPTFGADFRRWTSAWGPGAEAAPARP